MKWTSQPTKKSSAWDLFWLGVVLALFFSSGIIADWVLSWWR